MFVSGKPGRYLYFSKADPVVMAPDVIKRNNVTLKGTGNIPMMFAHGFGCDQTMWRFITPEFENRFRLILFDYVGCGKSDLSSYNPHRYNSLDGYAQDIIDVCDTLQLRDVILVGHSVSAVIGILANIQRPNLFKSLILICPSPCYINQPGYEGGFERNDLEELLEVMDNNYVSWAQYLAPIVMKNPENPILSEELAASFCSINPEITKKFAELTFFSDNREDLKKVNTPSLILQCSEDDIAPDAVGSFVNNHLKKSILYKLNATGHCPHMSEPEETIACINKFLTVDIKKLKGQYQP
jgi:sigma-B regulation protein RsbQ